LRISKIFLDTKNFTLYIRDMVKQEIIEIPVLTHEQRMLIERAANRMKRASMSKKNFEYIHVGFVDGKMTLSESEKMKVAE